MTENRIKATWLKWHLAFVLSEPVDQTGLTGGLLRLFYWRTYTLSWRLKAEKLRGPYQCCGWGHCALMAPSSWNETLCWEMAKLWAWMSTQLPSSVLQHGLDKEDDLGQHLGQARHVREHVRLLLTVWRVRLGNSHVLDLPLLLQ